MNRALASFVFTGETLFDIRESLEEKQEVKPPVIPPKKNPEKSTLILVDFLPDSDRDFLARIMTSVGVSLSDAEILVQQEFPGYDLLALQKVEKLIAFGDFAGVLQLDAKPAKYSPATHNGRKVLMADTLSAIGQNLANEKRSLWNALKEMFS